jgi:hypothetical protein
MKIAYRKDNADIVAVNDGLNADCLANGLALLVCDDVPALLDAEGQLLPGKTLADIPDAAERLCADIRDKIDAATDAKILEGYVYRGVKFDLYLETQVDFLGLYIFRDAIVFPFPVKGAGMTFLELLDIEDLVAFASGGMLHKQTCIQAGWAKKKSLDVLTLPELAVYEVSS